jgi:hypothetical protein
VAQILSRDKATGTGCDILGKPAFSRLACGLCRGGRAGRWSFLGLVRGRGCGLWAFWREHLREGFDAEHPAEREKHPAGLRRLGQECRHVRIGQKVLQMRAKDLCLGHEFYEPAIFARQDGVWVV